MGIRIQPREIHVPEDDPFKNDLLGRQEPVEVLTHLIGNLEGPCVLAVDAAWGKGKTTFLKIWTQYLRNDGFPVVEFNAWETDFSGDPFLALSTELTEGLHKCTKGQMARKIDAIRKAALKVLRRVGPDIVQDYVAQIPYIGPLLGKILSFLVKDKLSSYQETQNSVKAFKQTLQDAAETLSNSSKGRPLIVVIDELDRCRPSYAVELLEVAKHLFSVDHIIFVLAVNRSELAHSVKAIYGSDFDAEGYLRRFIDLDFRLPEPSRDEFIRVRLHAIGIADYFDQTPENPSYYYPVYFPEMVERKESGEILRAMLQMFFGASDLSSTLYEFGQVSACNRPIASSPADRPEGFLPTRYRALMLKNTRPSTGAAVPLPKRR